MTRATIRQVLAAERPLVTPLAHDALSARLIQRAGFRAFTVGGSALLAARHAFPDIGLHNIDLIMSITFILIVFAAVVSSALLVIDRRLHRRI